MNLQEQQFANYYDTALKYITNTYKNKNFSDTAINKIVHIAIQNYNTNDNVEKVNSDLDKAVNKYLSYPSPSPSSYKKSTTKLKKFIIPFLILLVTIIIIILLLIKL